MSHEKDVSIVDFEELSVIENVDFDETNGLYCYHQTSTFLCPAEVCCLSRNCIIEVIHRHYLA